MPQARRPNPREERTHHQRLVQPRPRGAVVAALHRAGVGLLPRVFPHMRRQSRRLSRRVGAPLPCALRTRGEHAQPDAVQSEGGGDEGGEEAALDADGHSNP